MPELPEVQCLVNRLEPLLRGKTIEHTTVDWRRTVATPKVDSFIDGLCGATIESITRRAKFLVLRLTGNKEPLYLIVHLRMSGRLQYHEQQDTQRHERVRITFTDGWHLSFLDPRKFGRVWLVSDPESVLKDLGPEPLDRTFNEAALAALLKERKMRLKPLLLNQRIIAGLGNIYVDESLWRSRLHPLLRSDRLTAEQIKQLYRAIRSTLTLAIRHQGTDYGDGVIEFGVYKPQVYARTGEPCRRCKTAIKRLQVAQRGTHVCPVCQPRMNRSLSLRSCKC